MLSINVIMGVVLKMMCILAETGGAQGNSGVWLSKESTGKGVSHSRETGKDFVR